MWWLSATGSPRLEEPVSVSFQPWLCVSGQAGLHGNVLQSCCLLAAFCWSKCEADGGETTETNCPLLLGPAPPVQALLSSLPNTQLCFHTLEGPGASSCKGQAMTRETVMSQTAHCWHLYWYFWLIATSPKSTGEKTFFPSSFCSCLMVNRNGACYFITFSQLQ